MRQLLCAATAAAAAVVLAIGTGAAVAQDGVGGREPKFPLKSQRMIYTDADIATARVNAATYPAASKVADEVIAKADEWVVMSDDELRGLITTAKVPRAFDVGTVGCPKCGKEILQKHGQYGWVTDPKRPLKVKCPVDGSEYPSNDYAAYYKSGFTEKKGWDTEFVDDGWGWTDPKTGEKFWFVAFANHWMWHRHLVPGVNAMAKAYLLTGDRRYAHKAAVALARIAEVYPAMDHADQSRYGQLVKQQGGRYEGKVVNKIWECGLITSLAQAYDAVWETIDGDAELQKAAGKTGQQLRAYIEANLLEDAIDAVLAGKIVGNFGMHQEAMTTLALARQHGDHGTWLGGMVGRSTGRVANLGLNYALYNLVFRDGVPFESAPGYNNIWVRAIAAYAPLLRRAGYDVLATPKTKRLFDGIIDQVVVRAHTPSIGDSGSVWGGLSGNIPSLFRVSYAAYGDERHANFLASMGAAGEEGFTTFESLLTPPVPAADKVRPAQASRVLDGFGMAVLSDPRDRVAASMYYGLKAGHGHFDRLNFELFAHGVPIMPDLGYPDAMNDFVPGIYTWSKNTVSHNCVVVDARRQVGNAAGTVELLADSPVARVMDVEARETYPQCSTYRRAMVMVDVPGGGGGGDGGGGGRGGESYFVDFFTVAGGRQHDYSLHGPLGAFEMVGGRWGEKRPGTLAGPDVAVGAFYDDPKLAETGPKTGFGGYQGSGFQHLTDVVPLEGGEGEWVAQWAHEAKPALKLRVRVLPQEGQQVVRAKARVSPVKQPQELTYLIARRQGADGLSSRFVGVLEPYGGDKPSMTGAKRLEPEEGEGTAVVVTRDGGETDVIVYDPAGTAKRVEGIRTDARVAVVTRAADGAVRRVFFAGGTSLEAGGREFRPETRELTGPVVGVEPKASAVRVKVEESVKPAALVGRVVHFENDLRRRTAHTVAGARREGDEVVLTLRDDLLVGRVRADAVEGDVVKTGTAMPLAAVYRGTTLADERMRPVGRVREVAGGKIHLAPPLAAPLPATGTAGTGGTGGGTVAAGEDAWLVNVGAGDRLVVPSVFWQQDGNGRGE